MIRVFIKFVVSKNTLVILERGSFRYDTETEVKKNCMNTGRGREIEFVKQ